ncbi:hypothetical protein D3C81_1705570 [compost metagenome]
MVGDLGFEHSGQDRHRTVEVLVGIQLLVALLPPLCQGRVAPLLGLDPLIKVLIGRGGFYLDGRHQACGYPHGCSEERQKSESLHIQASHKTGFYESALNV